MYINVNCFPFRVIPYHSLRPLSSPSFYFPHCLLPSFLSLSLSLSLSLCLSLSLSVPPSSLFQHVFTRLYSKNGRPDYVQKSKLYKCFTRLNSPLVYTIFCLIHTNNDILPTSIIPELCAVINRLFMPSGVYRCLSRRHLCLLYFLVLFLHPWCPS